MPYTNVRLIATGVVMSEVSCDLETGTIIAIDTGYPCIVLRAYSRLKFSPNLNERMAYDRIVANLSNLPPRITHRKHLNKSSCVKLLDLINDPSPSSKHSEDTWYSGYRDGWSVSIVLSGSLVPDRILGPCISLNSREKGEQIIDAISSENKLFF